ncbi:AAA family ATPase [Nocardia sp. NPDC004085]
MSVLWLTGAPGVGKSTAGWALYSWARASHRPVAYVDIDQLGLLVPPPVGDPEAHRLKAANLVRVLDTFRRRGARQVVVSGVVDPSAGIDAAVREAADVEVTLIRLRCAREELRRRCLARGSSSERLDELMAVADAFDRNGVGRPLDTTAMSPRTVVEALADRICPAAVGFSPVSSSAPEVGPRVEPSPVLLLTGATAVGKSTVGWEVLRIVRGRGITAAYVDVDQLGFGPSGFAAKTDNLLAVWRGYRHAGARALIVVVRGAPDRYREALAGERVVTACLEASPAELARRIARRARGDGPRLAGDSLVGAPAGQQLATVRRAIEEAAVLRGGGGADVVIDTGAETGSTVAAALAGVLAPVCQA